MFPLNSVCMQMHILKHKHNMIIIMLYYYLITNILSVGLIIHSVTTTLTFIFTVGESDGTVHPLPRGEYNIYSH